MLVKDFIQTELVHIYPDANLVETAEEMLVYHAESLLVFDDGHSLGVIGLRDLFTAPISYRYLQTIFRLVNQKQYDWISDLKAP